MFATNTKDNITADIKSGTARVGNDIKKTARDVRDDLNSPGLEGIAYDVGQRAHDYIDSAGKEVTEISDKLVSQIRANPVQSAAIAAAVGFLFGLALRR
jgi:ElaB/YqjD/DUF883 family membrane-anchored ribosome-binding protein